MLSLLDVLGYTGGEILDVEASAFSISSRFLLDSLESRSKSLLGLSLGWRTGPGPAGSRSARNR